MPDERYIGPVRAVAIYKNDVVVRRQGKRTTSAPATRGAIKELSRASRARLAFVAANTDVEFRTMLTLTYPQVYPNDGKEVKTHLYQMLRELKKVCRGTDYLWFLEFQRRGAPHIHILLDYPMPAKADDKKSLRKHIAWLWFGIAGTKDQKHLLAGTRMEALRSPEGGAHYAVKYASKTAQKIVPDAFQNVGRFWGHSKAVRPTPGQILRCTEDDVRAVLDGWPYAPSDERPVYKVLYNQADAFRAWVDGVDISPNS